MSAAVSETQDASVVSRVARVPVRWLLAASIAAFVVVVVAVSAWHLWKVSRHLTTARTLLLSAEQDVRAGKIAAGDQTLQRAEAELVAATEILHGSRELGVASVLPVARQNIQSLRSSVALAYQMTSGGEDILRAGKDLIGPDGRLDVSLRGGTVPMASASAIQAQLKSLAYNLPGRDDVPHYRFLIGKVSALQNKVYGQAVRLRSQFATAGRGLDLLTRMAGADGPRRYLLAVANAAEMRGTGGMILSYGVLSGNGGKFTLDKFGPIDDIPLPAPATLATTPDYVTRFSNLSPTSLWRNANLGADFTTVAPVLESMYQAATGIPVDGVIQIDSMGLADLVRATGPVQVADVGEVNADNVVPLTLNEFYVRFPDRPVRQEYLGSVAETVFRRLVTGDFSDVRPLGNGVAQAVRARNVLFHATNADDNRIAGVLGAAGGLPATPDFAALTVQNLSGNKLDYYLDTHIGITGKRQVGERSTVRVTVDVANTAPPNGTPPYIFGPFDSSLKPGEYVGDVSVYLPSGTQLVGSSSTAASTNAEDGRTVIAFREDLAAGERQTVTLDVRLPPRPPGTYQLVLATPARVRPTSASIDIEADGGHLRRALVLSTPIALSR